MNHHEDAITIKKQLQKLGFDDSGVTMLTFARLLQACEFYQEQAVMADQTKEGYRKLFTEILGEITHDQKRIEVKDYMKRFRELGG